MPSSGYATLKGFSTRSRSGDRTPGIRAIGKRGRKGLEPLKHVTPIAALSEAGRWNFAGTAFCFRAPEYLVTASHCIGDLPTARIGYAADQSTRIVPLMEVHRHPTADIAIMRIPEPSPFVPFWNFVGNYGLGEEFRTFGFPYEDLRDGRKNLLPRWFHGYFQRVFDYEHGPWKYSAAEINTPAPLGLSGAPLFRPGAEQMVTGVVTANFSSELVEDYYEEEDKKGGRTVHRTARITTYGVALLLQPLAEWLNAHLPALDLDRAKVWAREF
jgi:hypothetical protein